MSDVHTSGVDVILNYESKLVCSYVFVLLWNLEKKFATVLSKYKMKYLLLFSFGK